MNRRRPRSAAPALLALLAAVLAQRARPQGDPAPAAAAGAAPVVTVNVQHGVLGCMFDLSIHDRTEADARRLLAAAVAERDRVENALGGWRADTALARLNATAAAGPVAPPPLLFDAVARARDLTRATGGAFDVTVGPPVDAYGVRGAGGGRRPPPAELPTLRACVGIDHVALDLAARTIAFARPGVKVDLNGLNKGVAVDRVIDRF